MIHRPSPTNRLANRKTRDMTNPLVITANVLKEIRAERIAQDDKWGEQNHPDGTGSQCDRDMVQMAQHACQTAAAQDASTWRLILNEEVCEAHAETNPVKLRAELLQVAAVAVAWIEAIDRRTTTETSTR